MLNPARFVWKTFTKSFVYFLFALGSLTLVTAVFPLIVLFAHPASRRNRALRYATFMTFRLMLSFSWFLGLVKIRISAEDRKKLKNLRSAVIVANHPSLLDITILISFLPQADCIVNAKLFERPIVKHVVRRLFVPNSLDFGEILSASGRSLGEGNCLVIFPEGSRTKPGIKPVIKKGSVRIALVTGCPVVPIRIDANDMRGLQKGDPFWKINLKGRYQYSFTVLDPIDPACYASFEQPIAARKMASDVYLRLFPEA
jgi:1-acyl-sn-glycerol-3-phosphate acyltransferase